MTSARLEAYLRRLGLELRKRGLLDPRSLEEARDHLVDAIEDGLRRGLSIDAAEREAFARFGSPDAVARQFALDRPKEAKDGPLGFLRRRLPGLMGTAPREQAHLLMRDAIYGLRLMRKHSVTTVAAMLAIALGVGVNTAMFTVVNATLLQLPFKDPDRLVQVLERRPEGYWAAIPVPQILIWADLVAAMDSVAGYSLHSPALTGRGGAERLRLECVSTNMFQMLGVAPALGRTFTSHDEATGAPVIVVSHTFWTRHLGRDPRSLGRVLTLDGEPVTVIGVMPLDFDGPYARGQIDGWIPLTPCLAREHAAGRAPITAEIFGKLKPGVDRRVAEAQMDAATEQTTPSNSFRVHLTPLTDVIYGDVKPGLMALLGAAGFVLLIACANVASLLLGRADARRGELAVRAALGCNRARMVRQFLTESVLFALCGGAAGVLMAQWTLRTLVSMMPEHIERIDHVALDGQVLAASLVLSTVTGLLFGLLPAIAATRVDPGAALKTSAPLAAPSRRGARGVLIVAEVAMSLALLTGAGLLIKTFLHLRPVDPGFEPEGKLAARIVLPQSRYADAPARTAFVERLRQRLLLRPGVQAVGAASYLPLSGFVTSAEVRHQGMDPSRSVRVNTPRVTANYFEEMGISLLRGRGFTTLGGPGAGVAIVNETMARRTWPGQDPLGRRLVFTDSNGVSTKTIVGVARDVRFLGRELTARPELYVPFADEPVLHLQMVVKTLHPVEEMEPVIREEVAAIDPLLPVGDVESLAAMAADSVAEWRFAAVLLGLFAGIAASLAAVGLFAVVGSWVIERTPEIGIRMALGAGRGAVVWLFLARALLLTGLGMSGGLLLAALTTRFLEAWLVDASPLDPPTFVIATVAMGAVSVLATLLAARRAASVDPLVALRS